MWRRRWVVIRGFAYSGKAVLPGFSAFSGTSAPAFGVITEEEARTSQLIATDQRVERSADAQPRASAKPINRANTNSRASRAPSTPSRASVTSVHATIVAGTGEEVPCQAPELPWSTITVRAQPPFGQPQGLARNRPELAVLCCRKGKRFE